ncbi:MAG: carbohydrate porin [Gammaproteobacteria bacterium]
MRIHCKHVCLIAWVGVLLSVPAGAQTVDTENWNAKFQATYVWQNQPSFAAAYSGPNSLSPDREKSYSFTATAAFGVRPWAGGELYFDPEVAQGVPLSHLTGLGGFTNGEIARTAGPTPTFYRARLFLRQTWGVGGAQQRVESDANQLARSVDSRRWVLTAGNLSVQDVFDNNAYSHDPRTQFLNWALMTHGAYDYAADARGYSWGTALEYDHDDWAIRAGRFLQPKEPNQQTLDTRLFRHYGDQIELERDYRLGDQAGALRLLAYRNRALMARYEDALARAVRTDTTPDLNAVRFSDQTKRGIGINVEQALNNDIGLFARALWADGQTETYAFTEIDRSTSTGIVVKGSGWGRAQDTVGMAGARNALSSAHRSYLAAGGLGFFLGDGRLNYRPEDIAEAYYSLHLYKATWLTADMQYIRNPGYNGDRGPVTVGSFRLHTEF